MKTNHNSKKLLLDHIQKIGVIKSTEVLSAFKKVRRENFIPKKYFNHAYEDHPLPIGENATISQPSTIAVMLELLDLKRGLKVLEIGSGCGYVLALIKKIVGSRGVVVGVEINPSLVKFSKKVLTEENIKIFQGDGHLGLPNLAPFDRIIVSAGASKVPEALLEQLSDKNGAMVIPVGPFNFIQKMLKITKSRRGGVSPPKIKIEKKGDFVFVPLVK